ncbi:efflux RND transporter periplasmic adaptor subunit [Albidovulum inexpectatum]|nr:efflux RND transporter periplasmic adaptor subunit [Albidovulum inexpectatum]
MKNTVILVVSLGIIAGAYGMTFGMPGPVAQLWQGKTPESSEADAGTAQQARGGPPGGGMRRGQATTVVISPLEETSYSLVLRTVGTARSLRKADVTARETGEVVESALKANAHVEKGDVLLRLDDRSQRLSLQVAEAERDQARDTYERYKSLRANGNLTVTDVTLSEAEVALRLAEANVGMARLALEERRVIAPISGRMGLSDVQVGDVVNVGDVIVTIDDSSTLVVEFEIPERSMGLLEIGKTVLLGTPTHAGRVFQGRVTAFDSRLDPVTRSVTVQAEVDNTEGLLWSGMTFTVRMIEETDPLPTVPATAVTWDRSGAGIWVVEDGRAARVPVTIRYRDGERVWLDTTVPVGASVVIEGAAKLREGSMVQDVEALRSAKESNT